MLSSISPFGERARNSRWWVTVGAYLTGSTLGGAATGLVAGAVGELLDGTISSTAALGVLAVAAVAGLAVEMGWWSLRVPSLVRRQVNEDWLTTYRGWVYGLGFGFQLGLGLATIVVTSTVWLTWLAAILAGSWQAGLLIGTCFGAARGAFILTTAPVQEPDQLRSLFRRIADTAPAVHRAAALCVAFTAVTALGGALT